MRWSVRAMHWARIPSREDGCGAEKNRSLTAVPKNGAGFGMTTLEAMSVAEVGGRAGNVLGILAIHSPCFGRSAIESLAYFSHTHVESFQPSKL